MTEIKFRGKSVALDIGFVYGYVYKQEPPLQCFKTCKSELPKYYIVRSGFADCGGWRR